MKSVLTSLFTCLFIFNLFAQEPPNAVLNESDIKKFIKTYKPMTAELEELGHDLEMSNNFEDTNVDLTNLFTKMSEMRVGLMAYQEVHDILDKYGWDDQFMFKFVAISMGYSLNKMEIEFEKMEDEQKQYAEQMIAMMKQQYAMLVHEDDVKLVKSYISDLDPVFQESE